MSKTAKARPKAILKEKPVTKNCYVPGCYRVSGTCQGIPKSNDCAACRLKKNLLGVKD